MRRVLIVEDNPPHMQLAAYILERGGYEVKQAADARLRRRRIHRQAVPLRSSPRHREGGD